MKTLHGWIESGLSLTEYLNVGDEVDGDMVDYFRDILPPRLMRYGYLQTGEPYNCAPTGDPKEPWKTTWSTFHKLDGKWFWRGHCFVGQVHEPQEMRRKMDIEELDIPPRVYRCLKRAGINTVGDICDRTAMRIMVIRGIGQKGFYELTNAMAKLGVNFKES